MRHCVVPLDMTYASGSASAGSALQDSVLKAITTLGAKSMMVFLLRKVSVASAGYKIILLRFSCDIEVRVTL